MTDALKILRDLRGFARDKPCQFRIPGVCNHNPETSVWIHIRRGGVGSMGKKPPDVCGGIACSDCHDVVDGRRPFEPVYEDNLPRLILDGVMRSLALVWKEAGLYK